MTRSTQPSRLSNIYNMSPLSTLVDTARHYASVGAYAVVGSVALLGVVTGVAAVHCYEKLTGRARNAVDEYKGRARKITEGAKGHVTDAINVAGRYGIPVAAAGVTIVTAPVNPNDVSRSFTPDLDSIVAEAPVTLTVNREPINLSDPHA